VVEGTKEYENENGKEKETPPEEKKREDVSAPHEKDERETRDGGKRFRK